MGRIKTARYDTIYVLPSDDVYEHCMTEHIETRLSIIGFGDNIRIGCNWTEAGDPGQVLMFKGGWHWYLNPKITISDITFIAGFITGEFAPMKIENSRFMEATIHLCNLYPYWVLPTPGLPMFNYLLPKLGSWEWLSLNNTTWDIIIQKSFSTIEAHGFRLTITVCAHENYMDVMDSDIGNRRIYIHGISKVELYAKRNVFMVIP